MSFADDIPATPDLGGGDGPKPIEVFGMTVTISPMMAAIVLVVLGLGGAGYVVYSKVLPAFQQGQTLTETLTTKQQELTQKQSSGAGQKVAALEAELQQVQGSKEEILKLFGQSMALDTFLIDLSRILTVNRPAIPKVIKKGESVDMTKFDPRLLLSYTPTGKAPKLIEGGQLAEMEYAFQMDKVTYPQLKQILQRLEELQPLLTISNINMTVASKPEFVYQNGKVVPTPGKETTLQVSFNLKVVVAADPELAKWLTPAAPAQ
jgi:hypothetical protein